MRAVVFGTYDVRLHPRGAVLIAGLAEHGLEVLELDQPLGLGTSARVAILQRPWRVAGLAARLAACWLRLLVRSLAVRPPDVVLVPYLGHFDVLLARARWPRRTIVLDYLVAGEATARDRGQSDGWRLRLLRRLDATALRCSDVVVVDTQDSADLLPEDARPRAVVVPVGATDDWFAAGRAAASRESTAPLRVVFFGSFTPLQGSTTIADAVAALEPGLLAVTLVGTGQDHDEVRRKLTGRDDVRWLDWVDGAQLPDLVAGHDVCLGIFGDSPKALTVVPTKAYQGAAAGCALVTSDTPVQRETFGSAAVLVPPADPAALAAVLADLAADPLRVGSLRRAAAARAAAYAPARVVAPLLDRLTSQTPAAARS